MGYDDPVHPAAGLARLDLIAQRARADRCRHLPHDGVCLAGGERDRLPPERRREPLDTGRRDNLHRPICGVAKRDLGGEAITLADERRDPRQHHQVLRGADGEGARAEGVDTARGDGDDPEARERIVEGNLEGGLAPPIQGDACLPEEERIEEFAGRLAAATTALRERLESEVAPTDHVPQHGAGLDGVAATLHHRLEEVPALIRQELEEPFVDRSDGDLAPRRGRFVV